MSEGRTGQLEITFSHTDGLLAADKESAEAIAQGNPFEFHSEFHKICRSIYNSVTGNGPHPSPLDDNGFGVIKKFFSDADSQSLSDAFTTLAEDRGQSANIMINPPDAMRGSLREMVRSVLARGIADLLEGHYGSFFRIDHIGCMRTGFSPWQEVSFRWHRDFEPIAQVHIMIYLTPCGPTSPATIFTDVEGTRRLADLGYAFPLFEDRVADITTKIPDGEPPINQVRPVLGPGDATIFDAARIMHRGDVPNGPHRDIVLLNILPSLNPWQTELDALDDETLFTPRGTLWINPFLRGMPEIAKRPDPPVPHWAEQGQFFAS